MIYGRDFQDDDLVLALSSLMRYCSDARSMDSGTYFLDFYTKTLTAMQAYAKQKPSAFFNEKLKEFPSFSSEEIDSYLQPEDDQNSYMDSAALDTFSSLFKWIGFAGGRRAHNHMLVEKLHSTKALCESLLHVLKHPGFEELYYDSNKK